MLKNGRNWRKERVDKWVARHIGEVEFKVKKMDKGQEGIHWIVFKEMFVKDYLWHRRDKGTKKESSPLMKYLVPKREREGGKREKEKGWRDWREMKGEEEREKGEQQRQRMETTQREIQEIRLETKDRKAE